MNLAVILQIFTLFSQFYPEIEALINRILDEFNRELDPGETRGLEVNAGVAAFTQSFKDDLSENHSQAMGAFTKAFDLDGTGMQISSTGRFDIITRLIPMIMENQEVIEKTLNIINNYRAGKWSFDSLIELISQSNQTGFSEQA